MSRLSIRFCLSVLLFLLVVTKNIAQNPKIKCYFNHPVNNALSTGVNATYLKGTFPDTIVAYINKAKYTLDFAVYNFTSVANDQVSKIATAVNNAYKRGVIVRWINDGKSSNKGMSLLNSAIPWISSPNSSSYGIMHNKFLVIDVNSPDSNDAYVVSGSYNYSVQQTNTDYNNLLIVQNQPLASAYYDQFNQMWGGTGSMPDTTISKFGTHKLTSTKHYFNVNGTKVEVHFSPKDTCGKYVTAIANSANNDLTLGIYTFTDNSIATTVLNRDNKSVTVRGIEDTFSVSYSPHATLSGPLGKNFVVYSGAGLYHNKVMVVDALMPSSDPQVATGSFNWTAAAETSNDENLIIIHDSIIANQYYQALCKDISVNGGNACITPLPVNWVSLEAKLTTNKAVVLNWVTTGEITTHHFEVERSSGGIVFQQIGRVGECKNGSYFFTDEAASSGINYYRVKEVDETGEFTYSKVVSVYYRTTTAISIYPNPAKNNLYVLLPLRANRINIYDAVGTILSGFDVRLQSDINIDVSRFANGNYYLEVVSDTNKELKHFEKL